MFHVEQSICKFTKIYKIYLDIQNTILYKNIYNVKYLVYKNNYYLVFNYMIYKNSLQK